MRTQPKASRPTFTTFDVHAFAHYAFLPVPPESTLRSTPLAGYERP